MSAVGRGEGAVTLEGVRTSYPASARLLDIALLLLLMPLIVPLAALVALAVALDSPGPILYRSIRVGRDGRHFSMVKFRTMVDRLDGPSISRAGDVRHTPVGGLLATMRLDELPQAWNVLRGEMRLVGPRPEVEQFVLAEPDAYRRILAVPPGITGPTQLAFANEGRLLARAVDPERTYRDELLPRKVALDLAYVAQANVRSELAAIARTWLVPGRQAVLVLRHQNGPAVERSQLALAQATCMPLATGALLAAFIAQGTPLT